MSKDVGQTEEEQQVSERMKQHRRKQQKKRRQTPRGAARSRLPVWAMVLADLLCLGAVLVVFALFHHVLPYYRAANAQPEATAVPVLTPAPTPAPVPTPAPTRAVSPEETEAPEETEEPIEEKTGWAKTFEEHFTDEIVITENSYSSPNVSITVQRCEGMTGRYPMIYYVADIYLTDITAFQSYLAKNSYGRDYVEPLLNLDAASGAILAMNGDFYGYQNGGIVERNGTLYRDQETSGDVCVLYYDGRMVTYPASGFDTQTAMEDGAYQIWTFGPMLLDNEGNVPERLNDTRQIGTNNPRSAVGYYEPGHYCFVVVDGRLQGYSHGAKLTELAEIFRELGCRTAYNLDGGQSSQMSLNDAIVNTPVNGGRTLSDILLIREPVPDVAGEGEETEGDAE